MIVRSDMTHAVLIVGAGLSGLALACRLERLGVRPVVIDAAPRIAETWRRRHPQLRLNTHRLLSRLPGRAMPKAAGAFADRDSVVRYLEAYAGALSCPIKLGVAVNRIARADGEWRIATTIGRMTAHHVVVATGHERVPAIPAWPGAAQFAGQLVHAADFADAAAYRGRSVLVVGFGNSGIDVLNHLARVETGRLWLSARSGATILPTRLFGFPVQVISGATSRLPNAVANRMLALTERIAFGDLRKFGLPRDNVGGAMRLAREGRVPATDNGFVRALKAGKVDVVGPVARFEHERVVLLNGGSIAPDCVIAATGYNPGLEQLVGHLGVLDEKGEPRFQGAESDPAIPNLWFLGMRPRLYGTFEAARHDSARLARRIVKAGVDQPSQPSSELIAGSHHNAGSSDKHGVGKMAGRVCSFSGS